MSRSITRRLGSLVVGMGLVVAAFADPPTYATNSTSLGDATCTVRIDLNTPYASGPSDGPYRVSGTDCNFAVTWTGTVHDGATLTVTEVSLSIGGEALTLPSGFTKGNVRFASTHFEDSENSLNITWKAKFDYVDPVHCFTGTSGWVTAEFPFDPYNKVFLMGTTRGPTGSGGNLDFTTHSKASAIFARTSLSNLGHTAFPSTDSAIVSQTEGNALVYAETHTAYFAMVHGVPNRFNDSTHNHNDPSALGLILMDDESSPVQTGEIKDVTQGRTANHIPKYNTAVFYACDLLPIGTDPWPAWNPLARDSVFLGFPAKISLQLKLGVTTEIEVVSLTPLPDWIDSHVQKLYDLWESDKTAEEAISGANTYAMPRGYPYQDANGTIWIPPVPMDLRGDVRTTLRVAYLTLLELFQNSNEEIRSWYKVWST